jgi:Tol biopolymer transport system component
VMLSGLLINLAAPKSHPPNVQSSTTPQPFVAGVINTEADEYGPAFTPDGKTCYFTKRVNRRDSEFIRFSRFENGSWSAPEIAGFSGKYFDKEPFVTPDGKKLFFASLRPVNGVEKQNKRDFDIWYVEKTSQGWSEAKRLDAPVNTPDYENYPSVAANGNLYFASVREGGAGQNDLYRARLVNGKYVEVENLRALNTPQVDADPYIAPDESYMIFCSSRQGTYGEGDLYISFNDKGKWTEPRNLGPAVNTAEFEYTPLISPDKKTLFFSRGWGEIYQIDSRPFLQIAKSVF